MATRVHFPTPDELTDLLATVIAGVAGGTKARWRKAIGPVEQLPTWCNIHCNWRVTARGSDEDRAVVEQAVAIVRAEHPIWNASSSGRALDLSSAGSPPPPLQVP